MEELTGVMEELPPLELRALRDLDLREPPADGMRAHVASASGVVRRGDFAYVIGDEIPFLSVFRVSVPEPGRTVRVLSGEVAADSGDRSDHKADLEVLTALPPFQGHAYGAVLGLGSGSGPERMRGFVAALRPDGSLDERSRVLDLRPLYEGLSREIDELNVEGASVFGDRLWLMHRGDKGTTGNVVIEMSLPKIMDSIQGDGSFEPAEIVAVRSYDLGELDGVKLAFSDATPLGDSLVVFTASAEGSGPGPDGAIRGSVVGTLSADGHVQRLRTIDRRYKVEGVHASIDTGVIDFLFVCDQDDPETPSPLLSAAMPIDAAFEADDS